jgi:hypothetical protein
MWTSGSMSSILEANIDASENRLGAAFRLIANAPTSIWEMLFASGSVTSGPVSWGKGLCVITLHRLQHLDNIEQSLKRVFGIGLNCKLVCHGLTEDEKKAVKKRFSKDWPKLGYHFEDNFGLGKAISDAVGSSNTQFWSKIDDDDDYRTPYWYEIYAALRLSQCGYVGKRASLYHFVDSGRHYSMATATRFGKMSGAPGHIPGATLSGLTETVRRVPFPRFAKFHMDVAIGQKYHAAGIKRFIGSPFFMRVNRFATGMHTWQVEEAEIAANANRLVITEPVNPSGNIDAKNGAVAVLHRTVPGTVGYGFGNWAPHFAVQNDNDVREYQIWKQDFKAEPIVMDLSDRIIKNLGFNVFRPEIFAALFVLSLPPAREYTSSTCLKLDTSPELFAKWRPHQN